MRNSFNQRAFQYILWWVKKTRQSPKIKNFIMVAVLCIGLLIVNLFYEIPDVKPSKTPFSKYPVLLSCTIERVIDGDSIIAQCPKDQGSSLQSQRSIRLFGIDAPEMKQKPWGDVSKRALVKVIEGSHNVEIEFLEQDRYQRFVAKIYVDGSDVGLEMVRQGAASVYHRYNKEQDYINAEKKAKMSHSGIWKTKGMHQNPEKWRRFNP